MAGERRENSPKFAGSSLTLVFGSRPVHRNSGALKTHCGTTALESLNHCRCVGSLNLIFGIWREHMETESWCHFREVGEKNNCCHFLVQFNETVELSGTRKRRTMGKTWSGGNISDLVRHPGQRPWFRIWQLPSTPSDPFSGDDLQMETSERREGDGGRGGVCDTRWEGGREGGK